jgi:hypothetical protein
VEVFQENLYWPLYPDVYHEREFRGRFRVFDGDKAVADGRHYPGTMTLRGPELAVGVWLKDCWQLSPKSLGYDPATQTVRIGLYPGRFAGELDLMRTEVRDPSHYHRYKDAEQDRFGQYTPEYVPHDLVHSAMGLSRTHEAVLWFGEPAAVPDAEELTRQFSMPLMPFVSGEWNVSTGVMGNHALPGGYAPEAEAIAERMVEAVRAAIEEYGAYGLLHYGNVRYMWEKTANRWMKFHPKYAWFHAGHLMEGGTLTQALWHHYLRHGDPHDYLLAEARSRQVMDLSVVHYHDDPRFVGAMLRHGGPDPWIGHRSLHGAHSWAASITRIASWCRAAVWIPTLPTWCSTTSLRSIANTTTGPPSS